MAKDKKTASEAEVFIPLPKQVTTVSGESVNVPPLVLAREVRLFKLLHPIISVSFELWAALTVNANGERRDEEVAIKLISGLLNEGPEVVAAASAVVLDKPADWCNENLDLNRALDLVLPFLGSELAMLGRKMNQIMTSTGVTQSSESAGSPQSSMH